MNNELTIRRWREEIRQNRTDRKTHDAMRGKFMPVTWAREAASVTVMFTPSFVAPCVESLVSEVWERNSILVVADDTAVKRYAEHFATQRTLQRTPPGFRVQMFTYADTLLRNCTGPETLIIVDDGHSLLQWLIAQGKHADDFYKWTLGPDIVPYQHTYLIIHQPPPVIHP
jgi:hypothetical protein